MTMVSNWTNIERDAKTVWAVIEGEFRKTFEYPTGDLLEKTFTVNTRRYYGGPIKVSQKVVEYVPGSAIAVESLNGKDLVTSRYTVEESSPATARVTLSVEGQNVGNVLRNLNYKLMSWPLFRNGAKKRLALQLESLKNIVEGGARE